MGSLPDEVVKHLANLYQTELTPFSRDMEAAAFPEVTLLSVVRDEFDLLPSFFAHYRGIGVRSFVIIDNGSTDKTFDYLMKQPDTRVFQSLTPFSSVAKQAWLDTLIHKLIGSWVLVVDADELLVFPNSELVSITRIIEQAALCGYDRLRATMIDMYPSTPIGSPECSTNQATLAAHNLFDAWGYSDRLLHHTVSRVGGVRKRVFGLHTPGFGPELTKYPLFRAELGKYMCSPHHLWPYGKNFSCPAWLGLLHYKFLPSAVQKFERAVEEKRYWNSSFEYAVYVQWLNSNPDRPLVGECSKQYQHSLDLVSAGLVQPLDQLPELRRF